MSKIKNKSQSEYQKIEGVIARIGILLEASNSGDNMAVVQLVGYKPMTVRAHDRHFVDVVPPSPEKVAFSLSKPGDRVEIFVNGLNQATTQNFRNLTMEAGDVPVATKLSASI